MNSSGIHHEMTEIVLFLRKSSLVENIPSLQYHATVEPEIAQNRLWDAQPQEYSSGNISIHNLTSGRVAKTESGIQKQIIWPHTRLEGRMTNPTFEKLNFPLLIIGELGIIEDKALPETERSARSKQLKRICTYFNREIYEWSSIREYHGAYLAGVERSGSWHIDSNELASQFLYLAPRNYQGRAAPQAGGRQQYNGPGGKQNTTGGNESLHYYCGAFNQGYYKHGSKHWLKEKQRYAEHICSRCWYHYGEVVFHRVIECERPPIKRNQGYRGPPKDSAPNAGNSDV